MNPSEIYEKQVLEAVDAEYYSLYGFFIDRKKLYNVLELTIKHANKHPAPHIQKLVEVIRNMLEQFKNGCGSDYCTSPKCGCFSDVYVALQEYERAVKE